MRNDFYSKGYTFEEFEKKYGFKPYYYMEGVQLFRDDLIWYDPYHVDISYVKRKLNEAELIGIDREHLFETEDERFMRKLREQEERKKRMHEELKKHNFYNY